MKNKKSKSLYEKGDIIGLSLGYIGAIFLAVLLTLEIYFNMNLFQEVAIHLSVGFFLFITITLWDVEIK